MQLLAIQKIEGNIMDTYNMVFVAGDYNPTLILTTMKGDCQELYNNKETPRIPADIDIQDMVNYITEVINLFETEVRDKGIGNYKYIISELKYMYLKHGYNLSILTRNELEKALLTWGRALAIEVKAAGFNHRNTSYSTWEYAKGNLRINIPYTLSDIKSIKDFKASVCNGYGEGCLIGHGVNIEELIKLTTPVQLP
jgi:hypothetical protein